MINVNEVTSFVSVKAYRGVGFVAAVIEVFAVVAICIGQWNSPNCY